MHWTLAGHMAPRLRAPTLETRTARLKLKVRRKPYFIAVAAGINLGYRRNLGAGAWLLRVADGKSGHWSKGFGVADDFEDADGERVLDFWTAQTRARELVRGKHTDAAKPVSVAQALDEHQADLAARGGLVAQTRRVRRLLPPALLERPVGLLVMRELRRWRDGERARGLAPATVSRTCKAFAAALNFVADHDATITNRSAWKIGLAALPDSHVARVDAVLSDDEIRAVVAACYAFSAALGLFVEVLAVFGCRPVQASRLRVGDLQADRILMPRSAKGRGQKRIERRPLPLSPTLSVKLRVVAGDRPADAPLLLRSDGVAWLQAGSSDYSRLFASALAAASLPKTIVPYALRHSSIVRSLLRGLSPRLVADAHDTSVVMLERTYAKYIADHSDTALRTAQIDFTPTADEKVVPLAARRS
jgi:integrase